MAQPSTQKSTIVRAIGRAGLAEAFRAADRVAPPLAAAWAHRQWFRLPPGRRHAAAAAGDGPGRPAAPEPIRELLGSAFEVALRGRTVRGWTWGEGPVVYLVHGWAGSAEQLTPMVRHLLDHGLKVIAFDGLSHGRSDAGRHGPDSTDAVELGRCLDAVAAEFGPARAVVAHSMGALSTLLALRDGWLSTERLVLVAPVEGVPELLRRFRLALGFGDRTDRLLRARAEKRTGYPVEALDIARLGGELRRRPVLLVVHDLEDRETSHRASAELVRSWPGAQLYSTAGLGHNRVLADAAVGGSIARFAARQPVEPSLHAADRPEPSGTMDWAGRSHVA